MKSGTLNEANLIKHLIDCNYVKFIAEVGLVDHNQHVGISVSADGVCTDGNNSNMPLEVKTCIGEDAYNLFTELQMYNLLLNYN